MGMGEKNGKGVFKYFKIVGGRINKIIIFKLMYKQDEYNLQDENIIFLLPISKVIEIF